MQRTETTQDYKARVEKVLSYINNNLADELDLQTLASLSNFSVFHFHRIIKAFINEPLGSYIIRIRLDTAAKLIRYTSEPLNEICLRVGYDSQAAFTKAFRKRYYVSPLEYRNNEIELVPEEYITFKPDMKDLELKPKIREIKSRRVIFISSTGSYGGEQTGATWKRLFLFMKQQRLFGWKTEYIGICHDDPDVTEGDKCRYDACVTISKKEVRIDGDIGIKEIDGGIYAIFRYKGPYDHLGEVYRAIFRNWLPSSGYELRNVPVFEKYLNNPGKTKPEKLLTEIYVPIT
jgi:AraC family transcriptional regulator